MSTDWDPATVDSDTARSAFVALVCSAVWLLCLPFDLFASLRDGRHPQDDAQDLGADWAREGSFQPHNDGCNAA